MAATLEALIAENRELRRERNLYRARLAAIERSRWWRLHPRRLVGGSRLDRAGPIVATRPGGIAAAPPVAARLSDDPSLARFGDEVIARGSFTQDWVTTSFTHWRPILDELEGRPARILEIGSFEGLSTCFLLWRLPRASVTCVDTFEGLIENEGVPARGLEEAFDANVALLDGSRVRKLVGDSKRRLLDLADDAEEFELVYVDGSHLGLDVLVDAALAWGLLALNGTIVFDDYRWADLGDDALLRPGPAIDAFCELVEGKFEVVFSNDQIALRRIT